MFNHHSGWTPVVSSNPLGFARLTRSVETFIPGLGTVTLPDNATYGDGLAAVAEDIERAPPDERITVVIATNASTLDESTRRLLDALAARMAAASPTDIYASESPIMFGSHQSTYDVARRVAGVRYLFGDGKAPTEELNPTIEYFNAFPSVDRAALAERYRRMGQAIAQKQRMYLRLHLFLATGRWVDDHQLAANPKYWVDLLGQSLGATTLPDSSLTVAYQKTLQPFVGLLSKDRGYLLCPYSLGLAVDTDTAVAVVISTHRIVADAEQILRSHSPAQGLRALRAMLDPYQVCARLREVVGLGNWDEA